MEKINLMLVVLRKDFLDKAIHEVDFESVNVVSIFMGSDKAKTYTVGQLEIPLRPFIELPAQVKKNKNFLWLVSGANDSEEFRKMKKFLMTFDLNGDNVIDFGRITSLSPAWLGNFRYIEENGANFFATGNEYMQDQLDLNYIPACSVADTKTVTKYQIDLGATENFKFVSSTMYVNGVNLAFANQSLRQSYEIAKEVFANVKSGIIKFVLIGLQPDSFCCDDSMDDYNFQHLSVFKFDTADLNSDETKSSVDKTITAEAILDWQDIQKPLSATAVIENIRLLKDYIALCLANNAKPVGVVFPYAPAVRQTFDQTILDTFRETMLTLEADGTFVCCDMFDLKIGYDSFLDMTHLNLTGIRSSNALLSYTLYTNKLIPLESFCNMSYEFINRLVGIIPKTDYNNFLEKIFALSVKKIRRKDKIKIGLIIRGSAEWFGDELYNLFSEDNRFEVTVFSFIEMHRLKDKFLQDEFWQGIEKFKSHGINVVALDSRDALVPKQDVYIFSSPYFEMMPNSLHPSKLLLNSLITHLTYSFSISVRLKGFYNRIMFHTAWKYFFSSKFSIERYGSDNIVGMPRALYSGYPRVDVFFDKNVKFQFDWKTAQPNAKKIIYAPHWSIDGVTRYATFQWNYQFMYEYAKAHPEISWVVKPHPNLSHAAVGKKVFPSHQAFEEYMQKWDDLPNAQVYTGAYYQAIFATSDGMIHDSGSFIAEYQYVDKPMIFLTRENEKFNDLGKMILQASYLVDGKDHDAIAAMMQKVFIEGDDYKASQRKEVFDKYLNYPQYNGMLASEFIYKSIADELKGASE